MRLTNRCMSESGSVTAIVVNFDEQRIDAVRGGVIQQIHDIVDPKLPPGVKAYYNGSLEISETYNRITLDNQRKFTPPIFLITILALFAASPARAQDPLAAAFKSPPASAQPRVWWHWMNANVTQHGIDVAVRLISPDGKTDVSFRRDKRLEESQDTDFVAAGSGSYLLEIKPPDGFEPARGKWNIENLPSLPPQFDLAPIEKNAARLALLRKLIKRRWSAGLSQAELARRANIRAETLNRIEKAKVTADTVTVAKIVRVLEKAERENDEK